MQDYLTSDSARHLAGAPRGKTRAPADVRKRPYIFCCNLMMVAGRRLPDVLQLMFPACDFSHRRVKPRGLYPWSPIT
jgi:hypothetical protein